MKKKKNAGVTYDPSVIMIYANELYRQASSIVAGYTFIGCALGLGFGLLFRSFHPFIPALIGAALLGFIGYSIGRAKSFSLRLEAQQALCQLQTELNTRRG